MRLLPLILLLACEPIPSNELPPNLVYYSNQTTIGYEFKLDSKDTVRATLEVNNQLDSIGPRRSYYKCEWNTDCDTSMLVNHLAGSVMFLKPDTEYNLRLTVNEESYLFPVKTKAIPRRPKAKIVIPPGHYQRYEFDSAAHYTGEGVTIEAGVIKSDSVYIEGLTFKTTEWKNKSMAVSIGNGGSPVTSKGLNVYHNVTIDNCDISGFYHFAIVVGGDYWTVKNSTISGQAKTYPDRLKYAGINLYGYSGASISNNEIYAVGDAVSFHWGSVKGESRNNDIYNNSIHNVTDDGIEMDGGYANNRAWGNRIINPTMNGISFQPQNAGPWYIIDNHIEGIEIGSALKFRSVDNFVLVDNTFIQHGVENEETKDVAVIRNAEHMAKAYSRNNQFIYEGDPRARKLDSFVMYSTKAGTDSLMKSADHKGDKLIIESKSARVKENNWNN